MKTNLPTVTLSQATQDMKGGFGPPPKKGWLAGLDATGKVRVVAGRAAHHILYTNVSANGYTLVEIVAG